MSPKRKKKVVAQRRAISTQQATGTPTVKQNPYERVISKVAKDIAERDGKA